MLILLEPKSLPSTEHPELADALGIHLEPLGMAVHTMTIGNLPGRPDSQEDMAALVAEKHDAAAVMWIDRDRGRLILLYNYGGWSRRRLARDLECEPARDPGCAEAAATMVSSALSSWRSAAAPLPNEGETTRFVKDNELSPLPLATTPWKRPLKGTYFFTQGGYQLISSDGANGFAHGFVLGLGSVIRRFFSLETKLIFPFAHEATSNDGEQLRLSRYLLGADLGLSLPWRKWSVGGYLGIAAEMAKVRESDDLTIDSPTRYRMGFDATAFGKYRFNRWLFFRLDLGVRIFDNGERYTANDLDGHQTITMNHGAVEAHASAYLGISFQED